MLKIVKQVWKEGKGPVPSYLGISEQQKRTKRSPPQSAARNTDSSQSQMLRSPGHQNLKGRRNFEGKYWPWDGVLEEAPHYHRPSKACILDTQTGHFKLPVTRSEWEKWATPLPGNWRQPLRWGGEILTSEHSRQLGTQPQLYKSESLPS